MMDSAKFVIVSDNLLRYSEQEALEGAYLNAVLILNQTAKDVNRKLRQGVISGEQASLMLTKIATKKEEYLREAKDASPRKFVYERNDSE